MSLFIIGPDGERDYIFEFKNRLGETYTQEEYDTCVIEIEADYLLLEYQDLREKEYNVRGVRGVRGATVEALVIAQQEALEVMLI